MSFLRIGALALRIVRQFLRDPRTLALVFLAPILVMTLLNFVLSNQSSAVTLAVVLPTGSDPVTAQLNQAIMQAFDQQKENLTVIYMNASDADSKLNSGDVNGVLIFPTDFANRLLQGSSASEQVQLKLDGSNPGAAKALQNMVSALLQNLAQHAAAGGQSSTSAAGPNLDTEYLPASSKDYTQTDALAPLFVGLFAFFFIFLLTSVSFLRERSRGTIERLLISPLSRAELVLGYVIGFSIFAVVQSLVILLFVIYVLQVHYAGNLGLIFLITLCLTIGSVNLGIFLSTYARNEPQVIQFIPLVLVPQALLGGSL